MKFVCSLVVVENIERARAFYEELLEQKVKYDFGENILFEGGFSIHLKNHFAKLIDGKEIRYGSHGFELYFEQNDLESFVKKLKGNQVEFIHELQEQPWRQQVVRFYDPDRNIIEVGESLEFLAVRLSKEGSSIEEIAKIINMGQEFVRKALKQQK